jgi:hypothetical protein
LFMAFVPLFYLGAFAAFLIWHVTAPGLPEPSTWRTLIVVIACSALAAAMTIHLATERSGRKFGSLDVFMRLAAGFGLAAVLSAAIVAVGDVPIHGPGALTGLPFAVPVVLTAIAGSALIAKAILSVIQNLTAGEDASERPYRIVGILALILAAGAGWAALA